MSDLNGLNKEELIALVEQHASTIYNLEVRLDISAKLIKEQGEMIELYQKGTGDE